MEVDVFEVMAYCGRVIVSICIAVPIWALILYIGENSHRD